MRNDYQNYWRRFLKIGLFLLMLTSFVGNLHAQGWEQFYGAGDGVAGRIVNAHDGNLITMGRDEVGGELVIYIFKLNQLGEKIWELNIPGFNNGSFALEKSADGNYYGLSSNWELINNVNTLTTNVFKFNDAAEILWEYTVVDNQNYNVDIDRIASLENGDFAYIYNTGIDTDFRFELLSANGDLLVSKNLGSVWAEYWDFRANDKGTFFLSQINDNDHLNVYEINPQGEIIDSLSFPQVIGRYHEIVHEEDILWVVFTGLYDGPITLYRIDLTDGTIYQGEDLSASSSLNRNFAAVTKLSDGFMLCGIVYDGFGVLSSWLVRTDLGGNILWEKIHDHLPGFQSTSDGVQVSDGGFVFVGSFPGSMSGEHIHIYKTNDEGDIFTNNISGKVVIDEIENCLVDGSESGISDWLITADKEGQSFVTLTDDDGNYNLSVDSGTYVLTIHPQSPLWAPCNNFVDIDFPNFDNDVLLDIPVGTFVDCPELTVNLTMPTVRPCFERSSYIQYCNFGTDTAFSAYIDINYDDLLIPVSSSLPWNNLGNNVYRFEIGDIPPLDCGDFYVEVFLDCDATLDAAYCMEAHAYPDSICDPINPGWSGAFLELDGSCNGDSLHFSIENTGAAGMANYSNYIIIEDVLLFELDSVLLGNGQSSDIHLQANGSTYILQAEQVPGAPGYANPVVILEGCGINGEGVFSIGFLNQYPLGDEDPFLDIECPVAVNSFDPNDKQGFPLGYGAENFILPETPIEYLIRFQNTGTDTAYTVVIEDELDVNLDLGTFRAGPGSHPYSVEMENEGKLKFTFSNINLPDSIVDEPSSHGFVSFRIIPKTATPLGTVIKNQAGIIFDFNLAIITNETFHTIQQDFIEITTGTITHPELSTIEVLVHPNPFAEQTMIDIHNHYAKEYVLKLFTLQGQQIREEEHFTAQILFERKDLPTGVYFYQITAEDGFLHSGRIVVH